MEENKKQKFEDIISIIFLICFGFGSGYYLCKTLDENADFRFDFERKDYIPYTFNNELYLINRKNGKTYKLNEYQDDKSVWYKYDYIAKTKTKKFKKTDKNTSIHTKNEKQNWAF